jgi:Flp pilus assembly protein TadG
MFKNRKKTKGQGMVEFALVLPITLLIVFGVIEFGYLLFVYSAVNTASRDAARYGIAVGDAADGGSELRYYDCEGILNAGLNFGRYAGILDTDFTIEYDHGPSSTLFSATPFTDCPTLAGNDGEGIKFGDRIVVTVSHQYEPLITFMGLDIGPFTMESVSYRTIVKSAQILLEP